MKINGKIGGKKVQSMRLRKIQKKKKEMKKKSSRTSRQPNEINIENQFRRSFHSAMS